MRKIISIAAIAALMLCAIATAGAQTFERPADNISLLVITPTQADGLPSGAEAALKNKMKQMASANGLGSMDYFSQFCMLVNIDVLDKYIVGGAPVKHAQTLEFNFYIVDQFNQTVFAHTSLTAKGVGDNETKAYVETIKQLNARSPHLANFVRDGKQKIVDYYNANCDKILDQAMVMASMKQFEEALFRVSSIPDACTDCYYKALAVSQQIFQMYIDDLCQINLAKARTTWMADQNAMGAAAAGQYLSQIYPDASCYREAMALYTEIKGKVLDDWKFEMKMWQDGVNLESQRIQAIRDIGVAWGQNQQPITYAPAWIVR